MRRSTVLLSATVGFGLFYLAGAIALGSTPEASDNGQTVAAWFRDNGDHVRVWMWCLTLSAPLFATFAALIRDALPAPHRDVFFFGAIAFAAETAVQGWLWAGMAWHANDLDKLSKFMDAMPNVYVEFGAIIAELGRQPVAANKFFTKYQDRILFGKDSWEPEEVHYLLQGVGNKR